MIVDTSAIIAVLTQEDADRYARAIEAVETPLISAASVVEAGIVLQARYGEQALDDLRQFLEAGGFQTVDVTAEQAWSALECFARFGKGQGGEAALNYGDCFVYALAKASSLPLLFKGADFTKTDMKAV